jgi:hypothetical protein
METEPASFPPSSWVIGAAPKHDPYWPLLDDAGRCVARLFLLFNDHGHAERTMRGEMDGRHPELKHHIVRSLYDLRVADVAVLRAVKNVTQALSQWACDVVNEKGPAHPIPGLLDEGADVTLLPRDLVFIPGRLAVVDERAFDAGRVMCVLHPRSLHWATEASSR